MTPTEDAILRLARLPVGQRLLQQQRRVGSGHFSIESLPKVLLCIPLVVHWFWLGLRHRSLTLPSAVNPSIHTGGLAGESKAACLAQIHPALAGSVAEWCKIEPGDDVHAARREHGLTFPLIAKPDIGWCGYGVRRIADDRALSEYAASMPLNGAYILQRLAADPLEAGLFYVREPGADRGRVVAMTIRHSPQVTGDGVRTVAALIAADPRTRRHGSIYASGSCVDLESVPQAGSRVDLTTVASLRVGARYEDASSAITRRLSVRIESIARSMDRFHWGRFDVRFSSMTALQDGCFTIIEVNGAGSEAIHLWDPSLTLLGALSGVFAKQRRLFRLGAEMRARGHRPVGVAGLAKAWLHQQRLIRYYPPSN